MIPIAVGVKEHLIYLLFRRELEVIFVWIVWINPSRSDFLDCEIEIWGLTSLTDFYKRVHLLLKEDMCQIVKRKSLLST